MRNIFDQYSQPENRLTHALVSCLAEDRGLLRRFAHWVTKRRVRKKDRVSIVEQGLPGEPLRSEEEAERRGLPDACIYSENGWALLIESKIAEALTAGQLRRHYRTARRRGLEEVTVLAIVSVVPKRALPSGVLIRTWSEVYAWLVRQSSASEWASRAADYFVVAENRLVGEAYMKEGTLTTFAGIPFGPDNPYNYPEAKRLLKLAMDGLRGSRELVRELGMDPKGQGRGAITGKDGVAVWDFLPVWRQRKADLFTRFPHLTLVIESDRLLAIVTVPNGIKTDFRRNLLDLGFSGFNDLLAEVNRRLVRVLRSAPGSAPWIVVVQRRYPSQRAAAILDAKIEFDLRTAFLVGRPFSKVRPQPQWLRAVFDALSKKRSNLQFAIGAAFPYGTCRATAERRIIEHVSNTWLACKPLLETIRG